MSVRRPAARVLAALLETPVGWGVMILGVVAVKFAFTDRSLAFSARWVAASFAIYLVDALALFAAWRLTIRFPIGRGQPHTHLVPHAVAAVAYAAADILIYRTIAPAIDRANQYVVRSIEARAVIAAVTYAVAAGVMHAAEYIRRYRASRSAELRLRAELADAARERAEAEFRALKAEMNPQLLSDALTHVAALVRVNPAEAESSLARLGDTLRDAISRRPDEELAGADEHAETVDAASDPGGSARGTTRGTHVFLALFFSVDFAISASVNIGAIRRSGIGISPQGALFESLIYTVITTAALYVAIRIARDAQEGTILRAHGLAAVAFAAAAGLARHFIFLVIGPPFRLPPFAETIARAIGGALQYGIVAAVVAAFEYARRFASAEASGLALRAQLADAARRGAEAQLRALKLELNPHFLGNALATVAALIRKDPERAQRVIAQIDATLRDAISRVGIQEVTLAEEIESLAPFLAVERERFGERLAVSWDVDEEARRARVPHMILQPLIENAVKHGIAAREGAGRVVVAGKRVGDRLELSVRDDGIGLARAAAQTRGTGVGLANARARVEQLYGSAARLDLTPAPDTGTIARLSLPWR